MHPGNIRIEAFDYHLPDEKIAKYPLEQRDKSRLLIYNNGSISDDIFDQLPSHLPLGAMLVFNNSRVVESRLLLEKPTGGKIEVFALEPAKGEGDISMAMIAQKSLTYNCLVGGAAKWKDGQILSKTVESANGTITIKAELESKSSEGFQIRFSWQPESMAFVEILHALGELPIPPYLHRKAEPEDAKRYQTVYATQNGSVAAPTAGLHFTDSVIDELHQKGFPLAYTTLHVGAGTFLPVKADTMEGHHMHAEFMDVSKELLEKLLENDTIIPVGTTAMRTLESIYWMGVKCIHQPSAVLQDIIVKQWDPYEMDSRGVDKLSALNALLLWMEKNNTEKIIAQTSIIIAPGYQFGICSGLVTNFHQPKSTLLLLVAALIGDDWHKIYRYALEKDFRFLSFGDSSLILP